MSSTAPQPRRLPKIAAKAVEQARLRVVPRTRRSRAARVPFVTLVSLILLAGVIGLLMFNTSMQQASFAESALQDQATSLSARQETLEMELESLRDPQHVATMARRQGLVPACGAATLDIGTQTIAGAKTPADGSCTFALNDPPPVRPSELDPSPVRAPEPPNTTQRNNQANRQANRQGNRQANRQGNNRANPNRTGAPDREATGPQGSNREGQMGAANRGNQTARPNR